MSIPITDELSIGVNNKPFFAKGPNLAAASTVNFQHGPGVGVRGFHYVLTNAGNGAISVNATTLVDGREVIVCAANNGVTLVHSSNLILPGGANILVAAGDVFRLVGEPSSVVRCIGYTRANGTPLVGSGGGLTVGTALTASATLVANQWRRVEAPGNSTAIDLTLPTGASAGNVSEVLLNVDAGSTALIRVLASDGTTVLFSHQAASTAAVAPLGFIHNGTAWESRDGNQVFRNVAQGAAIANATDASSAISQLNLVIARMRATGDIAT